MVRKIMKITVPPFNDYMEPIIKVLHNLGGSATINELEENISVFMNLNEEQLSIPHHKDRSSPTEVGYRLAWARTYLKETNIKGWITEL